MRSSDKFETASEMNEMYDILLSDMSEKEQMEALNTPYRKKKPKARVNEKSLTDIKRTSAEAFLTKRKKEEEEEEEEGQEEGQEEEEPTVVTYRSTLTRIRYSRSRITTKTTKRRCFRFQRSNGCFWDLEKTCDEEDFPDVCRRQCSSFTREQKFAQW